MNESIPERLRSALADRYELHSELGAGGMATVYLADDLKHERKVAVKVLRPELAAVIGAERFITEIKTTAALQHPHILPLFDSGEADSFLYYVMPFVEGESLRTRLDLERQLEVDEAIHIAKAVASALQYAHERDVIHRDIKPENILLHAGEPVVADFGIALAISAAGGGRMTETGLSLGTPHYMSPEQAAADRDLSARSDVYSLACVLYEMLAGQPPHTGPTAQSILVRILTEDPRPVAETRPSVPKHIRAVVSKGLEKLPADRFKSAGEFKTALDDTAFTYERAQVTGAVPGVSATTATATPEHGGGARARVRSRIHAAATVILAAATGWLTFGSWRAPEVANDAPVVSFVMLDSAGTISSPIAGPDGTIAFIRGGQIFVQTPGALEAAPIPGVSDASFVTFSPDGAWIAFTTTARPPSLRKIQTRGGGVATLWTGDAPLALFPSWGDDGWIYLTIGSLAPNTIVRVPEVGGGHEILFESPAGVAAHPLPVPGGRGVLFTEATLPALDIRITVLDLESRDTVTFGEGSSPRWSPTGHLLYRQGDGGVWAVRFDPARLEPTGPAAPVLEGVRADLRNTSYAVSSRGTLVYLAGGSTVGGAEGFTFLLVSPDGTTERLPLEPSDHWDAQLSPDGSRLAYTRNSDVWIYDLDRGSNDSLTAGGTGPHNPVWSPDGTRVAYDAGGNIFVRSVGRASAAEEIGGTSAVDYPLQWLEDGTVVFRTEGSEDLFSIPAEGGEPTALLDADWAESDARVSPDGRWIAYSSSRSGNAQLYVRSWPDLGGEIRVSDGEAPLVRLSAPQWSPTGETLYYHKGDQVFSVGVDTSDGFRVVEIHPTDIQIDGFVQDMHPDGRLLIASASGAGSSEQPGEVTIPRLIVVTNWFTELTARLGGAN